MDYLFDAWGAVKGKLKDKYLFIFLDFDGTLAPIAQTPKEAALSERARGILKALSGDPRLSIAFISGRGLEDIKNKIALKDIIYAGNHGLEIEGPKIKFRPLVPGRYRAVIERIKNDLEQRLALFKGVFVEDKGLILSLHYRLADKIKIPQIKTIFHETIISYLVKGRIKIKPGKMVLEVGPPTEWDKGKVVLWLLARQQFGLEKKEILPIYIGDDLSDEDAFKALRKKGLTIFVGSRRDYSARYYLKDSQQVVEFLNRILEARYAGINGSKKAF